MVGGYLGSYTGVLLASTAVPVWGRSRLFLGPIFVSHRAGHRRGRDAARARCHRPARRPPDAQRARHGRDGRDGRRAGAVGDQRAPARAARLGLETGRPGKQFKVAKWLVRGGLALRFARKPLGPNVHHLASVIYLAAGLLFRYAWVGAGRESARHDEVVAKMARESRHGT